MAVDHSDRLAQETKRVLTAKGWSLRRAEIQTGVGAGTIQHMATGKVPSPQMIAKWARAIGEDRDRWLIVAGYEVITGNAAPTQELTREPDLESLDDAERNKYRLQKSVEAATPEERAKMVEMFRLMDVLREGSDG